MNPFEDDFGDFDPCPGTECRYREQDFRRFTNAPEPLSLERVRGGVVLIAGPPGHGKTVYGHRLLHQYQAQGLTPVELLPEGPFRECPARRVRVLEKLRGGIGAPPPEEGENTRPDDDAWAAGLRSVMSNGGEEMVVRLPCIMQNTAGADDRLAWEICQYAMAARLSKSVFIYEYNAVPWRGGWDRLRQDLELLRDVRVRTRVLEPVPPGELWAYVQDVIDGSPHTRITLDAGAPELLRYVFGRDRPHPESVHRLMRRVFASAIAEQSTKVTLDHLMPEAMRMKEEAE